MLEHEACEGCDVQASRVLAYWPKIEDGVIRLTAAQLSALFEGLQEYPLW